MIVEIAKAAAHHDLRSSRPRKPDTRRNIAGNLESRIIVPANTGVYRQRSSNLPIVLNPETVIIVADLDAVRLGSKATIGKEQEETGVDWTELQVVGLGGKKLVLLSIGFEPVDNGAFKIPAEFQRM